MYIYIPICFKIKANSPPIKDVVHHGTNDTQCLSQLKNLFTGSINGPDFGPPRVALRNSPQNIPIGNILFRDV